MTTHDEVTARLTQEWQDPAEKLRQDQRAREHVRLYQLRQLVAETQKEIEALEAKLAVPLVDAKRTKES